MLLLLFGVQLGIAAFFLFPSYVEYACDTQHLGVDLHHILVGDRFTSVGAVFCVLYPIPLLCSVGSAYSVRPLSDSDLHVIYSPTLPSVSRPAVVSSTCDCLTDALVSQHIFFGQLELSVPRIERIVEFLASSPMSFVTSQFARDGSISRRVSPVHEEVAAMLERVDAALDVAHQAVTRLMMNTEFSFSRIRFTHHAAFSGLKIASFVYNLSLFNPVYTSDDTLRRTIEYLVQVTTVSAETINTDVVIAASALSTLLNAIAVDAMDTLLRAHTPFLDHRQAITHCATTYSLSSPICAAVEMLLQNVSMVQSMRDDLATLKDTVKMCSKDFDGFFTCAKAPQRCTLDRASEILSFSESYLVELGASA